MIQKFFVAFIPVFVAIDPIGLVAIFMGLASSASPEQRKHQAALGLFTAFCVAIGFVFLGQIIFDALGITDADFKSPVVLFYSLWQGANCSMSGRPATEAAMNSELCRLGCR